MLLRQTYLSVHDFIAYHPNISSKYHPNISSKYVYTFRVMFWFLYSIGHFLFYSYFFFYYFDSIFIPFFILISTWHLTRYRLTGCFLQVIIILNRQTSLQSCYCLQIYKRELLGHWRSGTSYFFNFHYCYYFGIYLFLFDKIVRLNQNFFPSSFGREYCRVDRSTQEGEVAQWLASRICSANREVRGSNLTVSTDDPLGWASLTLC